MSIIHLNYCNFLFNWHSWWNHTCSLIYSFIFSNHFILAHSLAGSRAGIHPGCDASSPLGIMHTHTHIQGQFTVTSPMLLWIIFPKYTQSSSLIYTAMIISINEHGLSLSLELHIWQLTHTLNLSTNLHNSVPHISICICLEHVICSFWIKYLYSLASPTQRAACQYLNAPCVSSKDMLSAAKCSIYVTSVSLYDLVVHYSFPLLF